MREQPAARGFCAASVLAAAAPPTYGTFCVFLEGGQERCQQTLSVFCPLFLAERDQRLERV